MSTRMRRESETCPFTVSTVTIYVGSYFRGVMESIGDRNRTRGDCQHYGYSYGHSKDN